MKPWRRVGQFWRSLHTPATKVPADLAPVWRALFLAMAPADRAHALRTASLLEAKVGPASDLYLAALLHDAGKSSAPIRLWDRIIHVLARRLAPHWLQKVRADHWPGLVALRDHAARGADLVAAAGASSTVVALIRYHHTNPATLPWSEEERSLLQALQHADDRA